MGLGLQKIVGLWKAHYKGQWNLVSRNVEVMERMGLFFVQVLADQPSFHRHKVEYNKEKVFFVSEKAISVDPFLPPFQYQIGGWRHTAHVVSA
jgi:hypothetical protein